MISSPISGYLSKGNELVYHNGIKVEISNKKMDANPQNPYRLNSTPLNNRWNKEVFRKIKNTFT